MNQKSSVVQIPKSVPRVLTSDTSNAEIDLIWDKMQPAVKEALVALNAALKGHSERFAVSSGGRAGKLIDFTATGEVTLPSGETAPANGFMEWEIPRTPGTPWPAKQQSLHTTAIAMTKTKPALAEIALAELNKLRGSSFKMETLPANAITSWPPEAEVALTQSWEARIARQKEIDASIAAKADFEYLYDKPFPDNSKTRVAGPFTVESLSPHRTLAVDWDDELIDTYEAAEGKRKAAERDDGFTDFAQMILEILKAAGVQQAHKEDRTHSLPSKAGPASMSALKARSWKATYSAARVGASEGGKVMTRKSVTSQLEKLMQGLALAWVFIIRAAISSVGRRWEAQQP